MPHGRAGTTEGGTSLKRGSPQEDKDVQGRLVQRVDLRTMATVSSGQVLGKWRAGAWCGGRNGGAWAVTGRAGVCACACACACAYQSEVEQLA